MSKLQGLCKPNKDGKISEDWLLEHVEGQYTFLDENMGQGALLFFRDLMQMGLIRSEKIEWDDGQN